MSRQVAVDLPRVNTPLVLVFPDVDGDVRSRVEDVHGGDLVVAAVTIAGRIGVRRVGTPLTVAWAVPPRGLLEVPCVLVDHVKEEPPLWVVRPNGPPRRLQRRRFVRADVAAKVELEPWRDEADVPRPRPTGEPFRLGGRARPAAVPDPAGWCATGMVADLCEGGAKVVVPPDEPLPVGTGSSVRLSVHLPAHPVVTRAHVVSVETMVNRSRQVRLWFELDERDADVVRREVLRRQTEARGTGEVS